MPKNEDVDESVESNEQSTQLSEIFCPNCRGGNPTAAIRCMWCGAPVNTSGYTPPPQSHAPAQYQPQYPAQQQPQQQGNLGIWAVGMFLMVPGILSFMCVGLSIFVLYARSPAEGMSDAIIGRGLVLVFILPFILVGKILIDRGRRR